MKIVNKFKKLLKAKSSLDCSIADLESYIQDKSDLEIFISYQPSDGFLVMSGDNRVSQSVPIGMPISDVVVIIGSGQRLTIENFNPIG